MSPLNHEPESLRWALKKSGLTQRQLAEGIGMAESTVSEMLKGTRNARPAVLEKMAGVLNCPVVALESKSAAAA